MHISQARVTVGLIAIAVTVSACADPKQVDDEGPAITGLSNQNLVIGETLNLYGRNLRPGPDEKTRIRFIGTFEADDGSAETVDYVLEPIFDGYEDDSDVSREVLRISRFGPFGNPFSANDRPGIFRGRVVAEKIDSTGRGVRDTDPRDAHIEIGPSIIVDTFAPIDAACSAPALRGLTGLPYVVRVRAVGIKAIQFEYRITNVNGQTGASFFVHDYDGPAAGDTLGDIEPVIFNPVDDAEQSYVSLVHVIARDAEGREVESLLPFSIHRPIEVVYDGTFEMAERFEPEPVSSCIPGGTRTRVGYSETKAEKRQQSVTVSVSSKWLNKQGITQTETFRQGIRHGESQSQTLGGTESENETSQEAYGVRYGESERNNVSFSSSDGETWGWSMNEGESNEEFERRMESVYGDASLKTKVGVKGEGSIPGLAKATGSVSTELGVKVGGAVGGSGGQTRRESSDRGFSAGGNSRDSRNFGSTSTDSMSRSIGGTYGLGNGRTSSFADQSAREQSRTWDFSEGGSVDEVATSGASESEARTWVVSSENKTVTSFGGSIPSGQMGIFYRQTTRWIRRAEVRTYDLCGVARHSGELQFDEWTWAPDLAVGKSCDDRNPPPSKLEPAMCLIPPCGG